MIQVLPVKDREEEAALLAEEGVPVTEETRLLRMTDSDRETGRAVVAVEDRLLRIVALRVAGYDFSRRPTMEERFNLDFLLRAAVSYGEHHGAEQVETGFPDFYDFLRHKGFETDGEKSFGPVSLIVHYHAD